MLFSTDYREYFSVERNERVVNIALIKDLSESILKSQSFVVLTIAASTDANPDLVGYTVVTITLPETESTPQIGKETSAQ